MANLHILTSDARTAEVAAVAHVAVPVGNNAAGIAWRTAVVRSGLGGRTVLPDGDGTGGTISAAEKTGIVTDGSLYEEPVTLRPASVPSGNQAALNAYMDAVYSEVSSRVLARLAVQLNYYGATR